MNGLALCAGAGGLELGLRLALGPTYRCVCYVEGEGFAAGVLASRMQDGRLAPAPIWDNLRTFDGRPWRGRVDIVSAGFPCQPHSQAGEGGGATDSRWLWPSVRRVVREVAPRVVFLENVRALLTSKTDPKDKHTRGHVFGLVIQDLAALGYVGAWGCVRASDAGAPHRRDRVFLLAKLPDASGDPVRVQPRRGGREGRARTFVAPDHGESRGVADPGRVGCEQVERNLLAGESDFGRGGPSLADADGGRLEGERLVRLLDEERPARLWGRDPWTYWEAEPDVGRVADGVASRVDRLRATGNGVVPQQAALAFAMLAERLEAKARAT